MVEITEMPVFFRIFSQRHGTCSNPQSSGVSRKQNLICIFLTFQACSMDSDSMFGPSDMTLVVSSLHSTAQCQGCAGSQGPALG